MALSITTSGAVQVSLNGAAFAFNDPSNVQAPLSKIIPFLSANLNAAIFGQATVGTTSAPVTLPATPTQLLYAKNLSATATLTITWTPNGGSSAVVQVLQPGGTLFFFNPGSGISALSVVASSAGTVVDYVLAG